MKISPRTIRFFFFFIISICLISTSYVAYGSRADVEAFVTRFYQLCLGREPDQTGLDGWVNALLEGSLSGADVAYGFVFSQEFISMNTTNEEYVTILYRAFFNREPDPEGYTGWLDYLYGGASRESVLDGFVGSQEFFDLCAAYGINPTTSGATIAGGTEPAIITSDNALSLVSGSYGMNQSGSAINPLRSLILSDETQENKPNPANLAQIVRRTIQDKIDTYNKKRPQHRAVYSYSDTVYGYCGGLASITLSINDITGNYTGSMTFNNYCESGITLSGNIGIGGNVNTITGDILTMTLSFDNLIGTSYSESVTFIGSINVDVGGIPAYMSMNIAMRDNYTSVTYRVENFTVAIWDYGSYGEFSISGRFVDPTHGYVYIYTPLNFGIMSYSSYPHQGEMVVHGGNGTSARLRVIDNNYFIVEADTDGDGAYDWSSGTISWTQL